MSHKVHPKIFRIGETTDWLSHGFYSRKPKESIEEDFIIMEFLKKNLEDCSVEKIEIERTPQENKVNIFVFSARPGLIIGRRGEEIETLKKKLIKTLFKNKKLNLKDIEQKSKRINIEVKEVSDIWISPSLVGQWVAQRLEKRVPYRRVLKQALDKIMAHRQVQGAKIGVSGRLGGVRIARDEWLGRGKLPRQTIRADIDYAFEEAHTSYGIIGIKVWIYKGERFDN